jgi:hypothetical protein
MIGFRQEPYTRAMRDWLASTDHYLGRPPSGAMFCVAVREMEPGLFGPTPSGAVFGLAVVGRPIARKLPQDGTAAELLRLWLAPGLPYGTASRVILYAADVCRARGVRVLYTYHDRSRHTGCIYRKAGFTREHATEPRRDAGWNTRTERAPTEAGSRRRWRLDL